MIKSKFHSPLNMAPFYIDLSWAKNNEKNFSSSNLVSRITNF